jgi:hypothetical protein
MARTVFAIGFVGLAGAMAATGATGSENRSLCRIEGPRAVRGEVHPGGRVSVRPLLIRCSARARVSVTITSGGVGRLHGVRFGLPAGRSSDIRLAGHAFAPPASRRGVLGRKLQMRVEAGSRAAHRSFNVTLRRPARRPSAVVRGGPAGSAGGWPLLGIGDQQPAMFTDPLFAPLGVRIARVVAPWNVMRTHRGELATWLQAARAARVEPLVAFEHERGDRCPDSPCRLPSVRAYARQVRAFRRAFPWVRAITPWNEPNHASQPTSRAPRRAARYYNAIRAACRRCTLVAGDMLDAPNLRRYLVGYLGGLSEAPRIWGLHNYFDTTYGGTAGLRLMLRRVDGRVWLTETGGIVSSRRSNGRVGLPRDERRAAEGVRRAIAMAAARRDRVTRVYLYQWRTTEDVSFDAGLLRPDGAPRPGYRIMRGALRRGSIRSSAAGPVAMVAAPRRSPHAVRLALRCARSAVRGCAGRATITSAAWQTAPLVNGRRRRSLLAPHRARFALSPGQRARLVFRVPPTAARPPGARLRIELATSDGTRAVAVATLIPG